MWFRVNALTFYGIIGKHTSSMNWMILLTHNYVIVEIASFITSVK